MLGHAAANLVSKGPKPVMSLCRTMNLEAMKACTATSGYAFVVTMLHSRGYSCFGQWYLTQVPLAQSSFAVECA
jgi:hypothetical protein